MKALGLISILIVLAVVGYLMIGSGPDAHGLPTGELGQAQEAKRMEDRARAAMHTADTTALKAQVAAFQAQKGRLPASLDELKDAGFIAEVPAGVAYDPASGELKAQP